MASALERAALHPMASLQAVPLQPHNGLDTPLAADVTQDSHLVDGDAAEHSTDPVEATKGEQVRSKMPSSAAAGTPLPEERRSPQHNVSNEGLRRSASLVVHLAASEQVLGDPATAAATQAASPFPVHAARSAGASQPAPVNPMQDTVADVLADILSCDARSAAAPGTAQLRQSVSALVDAHSRRETSADPPPLSAEVSRTARAIASDLDALLRRLGHGGVYGSDSSGGYWRGSRACGRDDTDASTSSMEPDRESSAAHRTPLDTHAVQHVHEHEHGTVTRAADGTGFAVSSPTDSGAGQLRFAYERTGDSQRVTFTLDGQPAVQHSAAYSAAQQSQRAEVTDEAEHPSALPSKHGAAEQPAQQVVTPALAQQSDVPASAAVAPMTPLQQQKPSSASVGTGTVQTAAVQTDAETRCTGAQTDSWNETQTEPESTAAQESCDGGGREAAARHDGRDQEQTSGSNGNRKHNSAVQGASEDDVAADHAAGRSAAAQTVLGHPCLAVGSPVAQPAWLQGSQQQHSAPAAASTQHRTPVATGGQGITLSGYSSATIHLVGANSTGSNAVGMQEQRKADAADAQSARDRQEANGSAADTSGGHDAAPFQPRDADASLRFWQESAPATRAQRAASCPPFVRPLPAIDSTSTRVPQEVRTAEDFADQRLLCRASLKLAAVTISVGAAAFLFQGRIVTQPVM